MAQLGRYSDGRLTCYANITLDNGDPIYISVAQAGVVVKRSKTGLMGKKLYNGGAEQTARKCQSLHETFGSTPVDPGVTNPALRVFVQAALNSDSATDLEKILAG